MISHYNALGENSNVGSSPVYLENPLA